MKSACCTDREMLLSLRRFCTEKNCFRNAKPDEEVLSFYKDTMRMADEELAKGSALDPDKVETVVSNLLTVIDNAAVYFDDVSKDHRKEAIAFEITEVNSSKACRFLDESTKITMRYQSTENKRENANGPSALKRRKAVHILKRVLLVLLAIGFLIFLSSYLFSDKPNQPESGNFFEKIALWYKYDVRKEAVPVSFAEKWTRFSVKVGIVTAFVAGIWFILEIVSRIMQILFRNKDKRIRQEWRDYQNLCCAFEIASKQMNELEW